VGIWFRAEEPGTLAERMDWVRGHPEEARALGKAAGERAARLFSWERVADQYADLLRRLAGRPPESYAG